MIIENQSTANRGLSLLLLSVPFAGLWAGALLCPLVLREQIERPLSQSVVVGSFLAAVGSFLVLRGTTKGVSAAVLIAACVLFGLAVLSAFFPRPFYLVLGRRINPVGIYLIGLSCLLGVLRPVFEEAGQVRHAGFQLSRWQLQSLIVTAALGLVGLWAATQSQYRFPLIAYGGCFLGQIILLGWGLKIRRIFQPATPTSVMPSDPPLPRQIAGITKLLAGLAWGGIIFGVTSRRPYYENELAFQLLVAFSAAVSGVFGVIAILSGISDLLGRELKRSVRWGLISAVMVATCAAIYVRESRGHAAWVKDYEASHPESKPRKAKPSKSNDPANGARPPEASPAKEPAK